MKMQQLRPHLMLATTAVALGCCAAAGPGRLVLAGAASSAPAEARARLIEEHHELRSDGTRLERRIQRTTILTENAIDELGDPRFVHDAATERLRVVRAVTTMRDGKAVAIEPNSINETTPDALAKAPAYADIRETVITHVGMELGCTNELEVEIEGDAGGGPSAPFSDVLPLRRFYPVDEHRLKLSVPSSSTIRWACLGCTAPKPTEEATGPARVLTFTWKAQQALNTAEVGHHGHGDHPVFGQPRFVFSTAPAWTVIGQAFEDRFSTAAAVDDPVMNRAIALTKDSVLEEEKLMAVWRFVAETLATVDWPLSDFRFSPAAATVVLERSYGHSLDKAVLLSALLGASGIPSQPVLVSADHLFAADVPAIEQFSEVWVVAYLGKGGGVERWLSPTRVFSGDGRALIEGRWAFDPQQPEPYRVELDEGAPASRSVLDATLKVGRGSGTVKLSARATLTGTYGPFAKLTDTRDGAAIAGSVLGDLGLSGVDVGSEGCEGCGKKVRMLGPDGASFAFEAEAPAYGARGVVEVRLPWAPRSQLLGLDLHRGGRQLPMSLRARGEEVVETRIEVAPGLELRSALPTGAVENAVGRLETTSRRDHGTLIITRRLVIERRVVEPEHYAALRDLQAELLRADARTLLFVDTER